MEWTLPLKSDSSPVGVSFGSFTLALDHTEDTKLEDLIRLGTGRAGYISVGQCQDRDRLTRSHTEGVLLAKAIPGFQGTQLVSNFLSMQSLFLRLRRDFVHEVGIHGKD
jgi:hypothetical protein